MSRSRNFLFAMAAVIFVPFLLVLLPGATPGLPQLSAATSAITAEDAASHDGSLVTVEGVAREVHVARSGRAIFIDLDGTYPDQPFAAVIFEDDMAKVGDVGDLQGRTVDITGTIRMYKGRPEIVVHSRSQIAAR